MLGSSQAAASSAADAECLVKKTVRIAVTGGPGGGKTTALDLFRREMESRVAVVPESATLLFSGGFPRADLPEARKATQTTIFNVQRGVEQAQAALYPGRILLCDRGTVDGGAYWPGTPESFYEEMGTTLEKELLRYHAVIFFETAAAGGHSIESGNPQRIESREHAVALDRAMFRLWSGHPRMHVIENNTSFFKKVTEGVHMLTSLFDAIEAEAE